MTAREMAALIDATGMMQVEHFRVEVIVLDARLRFGDVDVLVKPVHGEGETWVRQDRVALIGVLS